MKTFVLLLLLVTAAAADPVRDGTFWQQLPAAGRDIWAVGWLDGICAGALVLEPTQAAYDAQLARFVHGINSSELRQGLNQFYAGDYRNLKIGLQDAALFVARYSREGMTTREAAAKIAELRVKYADSIDVH